MGKEDFMNKREYSTGELIKRFYHILSHTMYYGTLFMDLSVQH